MELGTLVTIFTFSLHKFSFSQHANVSLRSRHEENKLKLKWFDLRGSKQLVLMFAAFQRVSVALKDLPNMQLNIVLEAYFPTEKVSISLVECCFVCFFPHLIFFVSFLLPNAAVLWINTNHCDALCCGLCSKHSTVVYNIQNTWAATLVSLHFRAITSGHRQFTLLY